jgi:hypothetical protein
MAAPRPFEPEKLVIAVLSSKKNLSTELHNRLEEEFGGIDYISEPVDFHYTRYYDKEMGKPIERSFLSFQRLLPPELLAETKISTNRIEDCFREEGKRRINLDPGLLSLSRFVLATAKEGSHRIPLQAGIYGEVTLIFERGTYRPLPWTYPDYRSETYIGVLTAIRDIYRNQVRRPT